MTPVSKDNLVEKLLNSEQTVADLNISTDYKRSTWDTLNVDIQAFVSQPVNKWVIIPGLRGIGKTTLLTQLYNHPSFKQASVKRFYLSLEHLDLTGASINDLVEAFKQLRHDYPDQAFFICLDEVHFDPRWSLGCKVIFDQVPQTFLVCTGSSALSLRLNPDSARRAQLIKMSPLNLAESCAIRQMKTGVSQPTAPEVGLNQSLAQALLQSQTATQVYERLIACRDPVERFYQQLTNSSAALTVIQPASSTSQLLETYINNYGSLPFFSQAEVNRQASLIESTKLPTDSLAKKLILQAIDQTLVRDTLKLTAGSQTDPRLTPQLQVSTVNLLPRLARILANSERISLRTITSDLGDTHIKTLDVMLQVLVMSDFVIEVSALGSQLARNTKTPKYLFGAPALRQALVNLDPNQPAGNNRLISQLRGSLLEDTVGMYLERLLTNFGFSSSLEYDSRGGGADFVISPQANNQAKIVIEVGYGKTTTQQVQQTLKATKGSYGLVLTTAETVPRLDTTNQAVYVPLSYFLLT